VGATGAQGGAVVKALLEDDKYEVRALTRDSNSEKAKTLLSQGVKEVVSADLDDTSSMVKAFQDCYGAFVVTNYWADMNVAHEVKQHENAATAATQTGLKHVVLSTLEDSRQFITEEHGFSKLHNDKYYVPHFDGKGEAAEKFKAQVPTTLLYTTFYYENFFGMGPKKMSDDSPYTLTFPMGQKKLMMVATEDIGKMVVAAFNDESLINQSLYTASDCLTISEVATEFEKIMNEKVIYNEVEPAAYAKFGFPGADDLANMFQFYTVFESHWMESRNVDDVKKRITVQPFTEWLEKNKEAFH